jgi:hypothetical protein
VEGVPCGYATLDRREAAGRARVADKDAVSPKAYTCVCEPPSFLRILFLKARLSFAPNARWDSPQNQSRPSARHLPIMC